MPIGLHLKRERDCAVCGKKIPAGEKCWASASFGTIHKGCKEGLSKSIRVNRWVWGKY
jgi:predicted nucleic acid-binding Zn ribbon protein